MNRKSDESWIPIPGTVLDDRYRLGAMVDKGGMGVILRAEHLRMKREVAVKLLRPEVVSEPGYLARFRREVDVAAGLDHPNIVQCHDSGETPDGALYLVMELLVGQSLKAAVSEAGRFDLHRAADIALQLLDGLATAHMKGVVHRDLKPGNIFLEPDIRGREVVKILDFGLAKSLLDEDVKITKTGAICGTAAYLAPETLVTQGNATAGDVYACGLLMLEMVTGRKMFGSPSLAKALLQHLTAPAYIPVRIWDTPYGALIARCLSKHPEDRPKDAEEMYQQLSAVRAALPQLRLNVDEIPPKADDGDLSDSFLNHIASGNRGLAMLRDLPQPMAWAPGMPSVIENATLGALPQHLTENAARQTQSEPARETQSESPRESESEGPREIELSTVGSIPGLQLAPVVRSPASGTLVAPPPRHDVREKTGGVSARDGLAVLLLAGLVFAGVLYWLNVNRQEPAPEPVKPATLTIPKKLLETREPPPPPEVVPDAGPTDLEKAEAERDRKKKQKKRKTKNWDDMTTDEQGQQVLDTMIIHAL